MTSYHTGATVASDKLELSMLKFIHEVSKVSPDRADQRRARKPVVMVVVRGR